MRRQESQVLPTLRAALLAREGGGFRLEPHQVAADLQGSAGLEKVFGAGQFKTVKWYQHGLDCCESIARIETSEGNSEGTGGCVGRMHCSATDPTGYCWSPTHMW